MARIGFCARCGAASDIAQAGWQRDLPGLRRASFPAHRSGGHHADHARQSVLLGRSPGWPKGMYSCLAGFVEPGETIEAAVRREVFEEAGVQRRRGQLPFQPALAVSGLADDRLPGRSDRATTITIDPVEIEEARWVSREEMADGLCRPHPDMLPARKGAIAHFLLRNWLADRLD